MKTADLTEVLETKYAEAEDAFIRKDVDAIANLLAPHYVAYLPHGGSETRDQVLDSVRNLVRENDVISWDRKVTHLSSADHVVTVTAEGILKMRNAEGEITETKLVNQDMWTETGAGWVIAASRGIEG